jgi:NAD(P)H-dependent flavin oxidoreductase YrpB (nitropropane dioxygenase family)
MSAAGWLAQLGVEHPVVQAGMGGGISGSRLAAAVSEAGGLGTIGTMPAPALRAEVRRARERTSKPIAVNLLLNLVRRAHWEAAEEADVVVTFWGEPRRRTARPWVHQCGSVEEARAAHHAGADAVIVQGVEAGGHVRGTTRALELLVQVRSVLPAGYPVLVAGGIADAGDVRRALDAGAAGAVAGTRFLLSEESAAHPSYVRRCLESTDTVHTELFGLGWPGMHRVLPNAATRRWLRDDPRGPGWIRAVNRATKPVFGNLPLSLMPRAAKLQRPWQPFLGAQPMLASLPESLLEAGALYAGETVARIDSVRPAGALVRELAGVSATA